MADECCSGSTGEKRLQVNVCTYKDEPRWIPQKAHDDDAGYDLIAREIMYFGEEDGKFKEWSPDYAADGKFVLQPGRRCLVKTGVFLAIPVGYEAQIRSRSGLALKCGIQVLNAPGTIDSGYRGEVGVILYNTDRKAGFTIEPEDRVAQMVFSKVADLERVVLMADEFAAFESNRGQAGFGSTGV